MCRMARLVVASLAVPPQIAGVVKLVRVIWLVVVVLVILVEALPRVVVDASLMSLAANFVGESILRINVRNTCSFDPLGPLLLSLLRRSMPLVISQN